MDTSADMVVEPQKQEEGDNQTHEDVNAPGDNVAAPSATSDASGMEIENNNSSLNQAEGTNGEQSNSTDNGVHASIDSSIPPPPPPSATTSAIKEEEHNQLNGERIENINTTEESDNKAIASSTTAAATSDIDATEVPVKAQPGGEVLLKGSINPETLEYTGKWGIGEASFGPNGFKSDFQYTKVSATMMEVPGDSSSGNLIPSELVMSGYFMIYVPPAKKGGSHSYKKIPEKDILVTFKKSSEGDENIYIVEGKGMNAYGRFVLDGTYNHLTKELNVERSYFPAKSEVAASSTQSKSSESAKKENKSTTTALSNINDSVSVSASVNSDGHNEQARSERAKRAHSQQFISPEAVSKGQNATKYMLPLVIRLMTADNFAVFHHPVDYVKLGLTDYPDVIKNPMDLGTVKKRLESYEYQTEEEAAKDIELVFSNAMLYNPTDSSIYTLAKQLQDSFRTDYQKILQKKTTNQAPTSASKPKKKRPAGEDDGMDSDDDGEGGYTNDGYDDGEGGAKKKKKTVSHDEDPSKKSKKSSGSSTSDEEVKALRKQVDTLTKQLNWLQQHFRQLNPGVPLPDLNAALDASGGRSQSSAGGAAGSAKQANKKSTGGGAEGEKKQKPLTYEEKRQLGQDIRTLPPEKIMRVIEIIQENNGKLGGNDEEVEIDIDILETPALRALQKFIKQTLGGTKKDKN